MEIDYGQLKQALREVLAEQGATSDPELAPKYHGGSLLIKPRDASLQPKEVPLEDFFRKVVRVRDQLRVLEQKINAHEKLDAEEKRVLQGYITRSYGTLTTFNQLFRDKEDWFVGQKGK
ncbi:MAG: hypothetical protein AB7N76_04305 [Planctomycetota bacterium]